MRPGIPLEFAFVLIALPPLASLAGCDLGQPPDGCFPVPVADSPRAARWDPQGSTLQGTSYQGTGLASGYRGLRDLDGARLRLAETGGALELREGELVLAGADARDPIRDADLVVLTSDGREIVAHASTTAGLGHPGRFVVTVGEVRVCAPGDEGVFVPGHWDDTGAHELTSDELTYSCMSGVIAKCVDWGYAPWLTSADVHQACTRLARADYCGDGTPWTLDGTMIDVYDRLGVQTPVGDPRFAFEAAWGVDGALCVSETRYAVEDAEGHTVRPPCFADLPTCSSLEEATELDAVLANDSAHTPIRACE